MQNQNGLGRPFTMIDTGGIEPESGRYHSKTNEKTGTNSYRNGWM